MAVVNNEEQLYQAEKKHLDPDNDPLHLDEVVVEDGNEYSQDTYGEMVRAEMERRARAGRGSFYDKD